MQPNPIEWRQHTANTVLKHRNLGCQHESACVDLAALGHWDGFSCKECPLWVPDKSEEKEETNG